MMTYKERLAQIHNALNDPVLQLTAGEAFSLVYNWSRYELALIAQAKAEAKAEKFGKRVGNAMTIFNARHELTKL